MTYKINDTCARCGICVNQCPEGAIVIDNTITESDGLVLYTTRIDENKCTDCGICISYEWWCPMQAIVKV